MAVLVDQWNVRYRLVERGAEWWVVTQEPGLDLARAATDDAHVSERGERGEHGDHKGDDCDEPHATTADHPSTVCSRRIATTTAPAPAASASSAAIRRVTIA